MKTKERNMRTTPTFQALAVAVGLALGSTSVLAQQGGSQERTQRQEAQQSRDEVQQQSRDAQQRSQEAVEQRQDRSAAAQQQRAGDGGDFDRLVSEHDDLSTFVEALQTAGLVDSLTDGTSYTIFAPTDEAFESMRGVETSDLLKPENRDDLVALLRAHIVADDVDAAMAGRIQEAQTIDGETVELKSEDGKLMIGDATVVDADIEQGNLRFHSIDKVLDRPLRTASIEEGESETERERNR